MTDINTSKMVTIHIDESYHTAMKGLAKSKRVLISLLYEQAVEAYLDTENKRKIPVKKTNGLRAVSR